MDHQHIWQTEPPDEGKLLCSRTPDERQADEADMAYNSGWSSPEELQRLRLLVEEDPNFENSLDWPEVVEWCSSCTITRVDKPARLIIRLLFGFASDSETSAATP